MQEIGVHYKNWNFISGKERESAGGICFKENSFSGKAPQTEHHTNRLVHKGPGFMNCADTGEGRALLERGCNAHQ